MFSGFRTFMIINCVLTSFKIEGHPEQQTALCEVKTIGVPKGLSGLIEYTYKEEMNETCQLTIINEVDHKVFIPGIENSTTRDSCSNSGKPEIYINKQSYCVSNLSTNEVIIDLPEKVLTIQLISDAKTNFTLEYFYKIGKSSYLIDIFYMYI